MAAGGGRSGCLLRLSIGFVQRSLQFQTPQLTQARWSRYDKSYQEATISKSELAQPMEKDDIRQFTPIKAARNEETTQSNYDPLVQKFANIIMEHGKKELARDIIKKTFANIKMIQLRKYHRAETEEEKQEIELSPLKVFHSAVENCKPVLITQDAKRGGVIYKVPIPCKPKYAIFRSMKWLIDTAMDKPDTQRIWERLAYELIDAHNNEGRTIKKKHDMHRVCEANRTYAHYRWAG